MKVTQNSVNVRLSRQDLVYLRACIKATIAGVTIPLLKEHCEAVLRRIEKPLRKLTPEEE